MGISGSSQRNHRVHGSILNRKNGFFHIEHGRAGFHLDQVSSVLRDAGRSSALFLLYTGKCLLAVDGILYMLHVKLLNLRNLSQTIQDAFHLVAFLFQNRFPGILFFPCHIIVRMISGNHHQWLKNHFRIRSLFLQRRNHILQRGFRFHRTDIIILISGGRKLFLKGCIYRVGIRFSSMPHKADRRFTVIIG